MNPPNLNQGPNLRIEVQGENLRPFMRVRFGNLQAKSFEIQSTRAAMVDLPDLGKERRKRVTRFGEKPETAFREPDSISGRIEARFEAAKVRSPRRFEQMRTGLDALTPSELRVGEVAAQGLSTRQIAEALFITPKTVEFHLGNIYRKLDIRSRTKLAEALDGELATRSAS